MCRSLLLATLLTSLLFGCQREETPPPAAPTTGLTPIGDTAPSAPAPTALATSAPLRLLHQPIEMQRFELPTEALTVWRAFADQQPTLLLLSNDPFLVPVPEPLRPQVADLVSKGNRAGIARRTGLQQADPLLVSTMAVDAALRQGWFSSLAWVIPLRDPEQALDREVLHKQFTETGMADTEELRTLKVEGTHTVNATLRGRPLVASTRPHLPALTGPLVVHIDLSYFQPLYKNEVSTPLLGIVQQTLVDLRARNLEVLAVTFSYGNRDRRIALDVRFLGELLEKLVAEPERIGQPLPLHWKQQGDALYLANFFQKEEIRKLHLDQEKALPKAGWVKFNLYRSAAQNKEGTLALDYLAKTVSLDPVFALEYLDLAQMAYEKQRPDEALRMMGLFDAVFPGDPQATIQMAQLANEIGKPKAALEKVKGLEKRAWSTVYYPEMPEYLQGFREFLEKGEKTREAS